MAIVSSANVSARVAGVVLIVADVKICSAHMIVMEMVCVIWVYVIAIPALKGCFVSAKQLVLWVVRSMVSASMECADVLKVLLDPIAVKATVCHDLFFPSSLQLL